MELSKYPNVGLFLSVKSYEDFEKSVPTIDQVNLITQIGEQIVHITGQTLKKLFEDIKLEVILNKTG